MADLVRLPTYWCLIFARKHVTVALRGDGGDELWRYTRFPGQRDNPPAPPPPTPRFRRCPRFFGRRMLAAPATSPTDARTKVREVHQPDALARYVTRPASRWLETCKAWSRGRLGFCWLAGPMDHCARPLARGSEETSRVSRT